MHEPTVMRVELHDHGDKTRMTLSDGPYPAGQQPCRGRVDAAFDKLGARLT